MSVGGLLLLAQMHPSMRDFCRQLLEHASRLGLEPIVTETFRDNQRQNQLFAQGRTTPGKIVTNARGGESAHNYGLAMDVKARAGYESADQRALHQLFGQAGLKTLSWDLPHAEHPGFTAALARARRK